MKRIEEELKKLNLEIKKTPVEEKNISSTLQKISTIIDGWIKGKVLDDIGVFSLAKTIQKALLDCFSKNWQEFSQLKLPVLAPILHVTLEQLLIQQEISFRVERTDVAKKSQLRVQINKGKDAALQELEEMMQSAIASGGSSIEIVNRLSKLLEESYLNDELSVAIKRMVYRVLKAVPRVASVSQDEFRTQHSLLQEAHHQIKIGEFSLDNVEQDYARFPGDIGELMIKLSYGLMIAELKPTPAVVGMLAQTALMFPLPFKPLNEEVSPIIRKAIDLRWERIAEFLKIRVKKAGRNAAFELVKLMEDSKITIENHHADLVKLVPAIRGVLPALLTAQVDKVDKGELDLYSETFKKHALTAVIWEQFLKNKALLETKSAVVLPLSSALRKFELEKLYYKLIICMLDDPGNAATLMEEAFTESVFSGESQVPDVCLVCGKASATIIEIVEQYRIVKLQECFDLAEECKSLQPFIRDKFLENDIKQQVATLTTCEEVYELVLQLCQFARAHKGDEQGITEQALFLLPLPLTCLSLIDLKDTKCALAIEKHWSRIFEQLKAELKTVLAVETNKSKSIVDFVNRYLPPFHCELTIDSQYMLEVIKAIEDLYSSLSPEETQQIALIPECHPLLRYKLNVKNKLIPEHSKPLAELTVSERVEQLNLIHLQILCLDQPIKDRLHIADKILQNSVFKDCHDPDIEAVMQAVRPNQNWTHIKFAGENKLLTGIDQDCRRVKSYNKPDSKVRPKIVETLLQGNIEELEQFRKRSSAHFDYRENGNGLVDLLMLQASFSLENLSRLDKILKLILAKGAVPDTIFLTENLKQIAQDPLKWEFLKKHRLCLLKAILRQPQYTWNKKWDREILDALGIVHYGQRIILQHLHIADSQNAIGLVLANIFAKSNVRFLPDNKAAKEEILKMLASRRCVPDIMLGLQNIIAKQDTNKLFDRKSLELQLCLVGLAERAKYMEAIHVNCHQFFSKGVTGIVVDYLADEPVFSRYHLS